MLYANNLASNKIVTNLTFDNKVKKFIMNSNESEVIMICYTYDEKCYYKGTMNCQKDPLESKAKGEDVYLLPANATYNTPPEEKDGYKIKFSDGAWVYEEIVAEPGPEPYVPTDEEKQAQVRSQRNYMLSQTDYTRLDDCQLTDEEKESYKAYRQYLRDYTKSENWYESKPLTYDEYVTKS